MNERFNNIRSAITDDASGIAQMTYDLALHQKANMQNYTVTEELIERNINDPQRGEYLVAENRGGLTGFVYFGHLPTVSWSGESAIYIEDLFVKPDCRESGTGKRLIGAVANYAIEYADWDITRAEIRLDTKRYGNDKTQAFYRRQGFRAEQSNFRLSGIALGNLAKLAPMYQLNDTPDL